MVLRPNWRQKVLKQIVFPKYGFCARRQFLLYWMTFTCMFFRWLFFRLFDIKVGEMFWLTAELGSVLGRWSHESRSQYHSCHCTDSGCKWRNQCKMAEFKISLWFWYILYCGLCIMICIESCDIKKGIRKPLKIICICMFIILYLCIVSSWQDPGV